MSAPSTVAPGDARECTGYVEVFDIDPSSSFEVSKSALGSQRINHVGDIPGNVSSTTTKRHGSDIEDTLYGAPENGPHCDIPTPWWARPTRRPTRRPPLGQDFYTATADEPTTDHDRRRALLRECVARAVAP